MNEMSYQLSLLEAMNNRLVNDENMYKMICNTSSNAILYYHFAEKRTVHVGNWSHFFDLDPKNYSSLSQLIEYAEEEYHTQLHECMTLENTGKERETFEFKLKDKSMWVELEVNVTYNEEREPVEKVLRFKDTTKFKMQNDELTYLAYYDVYTGLLNRNYFILKLREMLEKAKQEKCVVSVLFVDVDDFRKVNDGMGMLMGDELVQLMGQALREFESENVLVSHFNSDIYCMAIYDPCGSRSVEAVIEEMKKNLLSPFRLSNGSEVTITVSIGVAEFPECAVDALELINCAEIVMLKSKHTQKNGVQYYDAPIIQEFVEKVNIEQKLERALKDQGFFMCYQPQYSTDDKKLRGVEALVRWKDEEGKVISPATFIPVAEKNGSILQLGDWILEKSISDFSRWLENYKFDDITLSINISALQFKNKDFVKTLIQILKRYHMPPTMIELEITESVFIDDMNDVVKKMNVLRDMGIRFSMDDFGTGFSSLSYLRRLPIDTLKIDKTFIDSVVTDNPTRTIAETIIDMGKKLGFHTIAEGVEDEVQFDLLRDIGCDNIQGYYMGKPMVSEKIEELLAEQQEESN